jgi:hypothetical protein
MEAVPNDSRTMGFIEGGAQLQHHMSAPMVQQAMPGLDHLEMDTLAPNSRTHRSFMEEGLLKSAPDTQEIQDGPFKLDPSGGWYTSLHTLDDESVSLLPDIDHTDLPDDMWGIGIMTVILDFEDWWTCGWYCVGLTRTKLFRFLYVVICGFLHLLAQLAIPVWLWHNKDPLVLLPGWVANPGDRDYDPVQAHYSLVPVVTPKPPRAPRDDMGEDTKTPPDTYGLKGIAHPNTHISKPIDHIHTFSSFTMPGLSSFKMPFDEHGVDKEGMIFVLVLLLWIALVLRLSISAFWYGRFICKMPKVNEDYNTSSRTFSTRPSSKNHVILRNKINEVFAITGCTKFVLILLMIYKFVFHLAMGYLGLCCLIVAPSFIDLFFTFLVLWFVGSLMPTPLAEIMLPWAVEDLRATKFANYPEQDGSIANVRQAYTCWHNLVFLLLTTAMVIVVLSFPSAFRDIGSTLMSWTWAVFSGSGESEHKL